MPERDAPFRMTESDRFSLAEVVGWSVAALEGAMARAGCSLPERPGTSSRTGQRLIIRLTPTRLWIIGEDQTGAPPAVAGLIDPEAGCRFDLSNSRIRFHLQGPAIRPALAMVLALDLDTSAFPVGAAAATAIHDVPVLLHRAGQDLFDVYVPRSFARSIGEWIRDAASVNEVTASPGAGSALAPARPSAC